MASIIWYSTKKIIHMDSIYELTCKTYGLKETHVSISTSLLYINVCYSLHIDLF